MWVFIFIIAIGYFAFYRPYQKKRRAEREEAVYQELSNSGYVQTAMKFLAFYHLLPRKFMLIVTPQFESTFMEAFFEWSKESLGGEKISRNLS